MNFHSQLNQDGACAGMAKKRSVNKRINGAPALLALHFVRHQQLPYWDTIGVARV